MAENPYRSPTCESPPNPEWLLVSSSRILRGMGWVGVVYSATAYPYAIVTAFSEEPPQYSMAATMLGISVVSLILFPVMIRTAKQLTIDFPRVYSRARWLGILAAAVYAPVLTVPAIIAIRRLEQYRRHIHH